MRLCPYHYAVNSMPVAPQKHLSQINVFPGRQTEAMVRGERTCHCAHCTPGAVCGGVVKGACSTGEA
eukprot:scaffold7068_cov22-Tisochrysis_lutea.AAC.2